MVSPEYKLVSGLILKHNLNTSTFWFTARKPSFCTTHYEKLWTDLKSKILRAQSLDRVSAMCKCLELGVFTYLKQTKISLKLVLS